MNDCEPVELFNWHGVKAMTARGGRPLNFLSQQKILHRCPVLSRSRRRNNQLDLPTQRPVDARHQKQITHGGKKKKIIALSLVLFIWSCYTQLITSKLAAACVPFAPGFARRLI